MISAIPLGGYVKLTGENPDELLTNDPREFGSRSIGVRWSIVFAGPLMNYFLAFILLPLVYIIGIQIPAYLDQPPIVQWVAENSPAKGAGLQRGRPNYCGE
jgi:regulator of sigma E protease